MQKRNNAAVSVASTRGWVLKTHWSHDCVWAEMTLTGAKSKFPTLLVELSLCGQQKLPHLCSQIIKDKKKI